MRFVGANIVEDAQGRMTMLDRLSDLRRKGLAARLLSTPGQKVAGCCQSTGSVRLFFVTQVVR